MKILQEGNDQFNMIDSVTPKRNIANVFELPVIRRELKCNYGVDIAFSSKRRWSGNIWYITATAPYIGRVKDLINPPEGSVVALFVDYDKDEAFAMPRSGADKTTMMLVSSVANKHVKEPFKCSSDLRHRLHKGGLD